MPRLSTDADCGVRQVSSRSRSLSIRTRCGHQTDSWDSMPPVPLHRGATTRDNESAGLKPRRGGGRRSIWLGALSLVVASGCGGGLAKVAPPLGDQSFSKQRLEVRVLDSVGHFYYCDPDEFPVGYGTAAQRARRGFPTVEADPQALSVIAGELHLGSGPYDIAAKERIWQLYKRMNAVGLERGKGGYRFTLVSDPDNGKFRHGFVRDDGAVFLGRPYNEPNYHGCPICLVRGTLIGTPIGSVPVDRLRIGDPIWTTGPGGIRIATRVAVVGRVAVGPRHAVIEVQLRDGRAIVASPGHPLGDGRHLMDLRVGFKYDGSRVASLRWATYADGWTYDVLPAGPTGDYWANGILVGSTLRTPSKSSP